MPNWVEKILKYNPGERSLKVPFAIYLDLKCLLKKVQSCQNNPKESYTEKKGKHESSGNVNKMFNEAMLIRCSFDKKEKLNYCRGKDCMEKLCKKLKEHTMKIINYEEKEMIPLKKISFIKNKKHVIYGKKGFVWIKMMKIIKIKRKVTVITQENIEELLTVNAI